jgi:CheY-like chemotaxis protein/DNA-directed RNA polymerase specialized sigma24 family protein
MSVTGSASPIQPEGDSAAQPAPRAGLAAQIAPHLTGLRRYARALCGSQAAGDGQVAGLLEAMIADPSAVSLGGDARVGLYGAFHRQREAVLHPAGVVPGGSDPRERIVAARLRPLTPLSRQALLLTALEGFTAEQAAAILGVESERLAALVSDARDSLRSQPGARVLVVEDEPIIAMDIEALVTDLGHVVCDIADTRTTAVEAARRHRPDLVLADIQLADGSSGIDAVRDILEAFSVPVVFITAYPDRLLTGQRPEPTFLISKPFRPETVQATIAQALFFRESR